MRVESLVKQIGDLLESLRPRNTFRKLFGILNALGMQVEDGNYHRHAVGRLCEALLATIQLYDIPQDTAERLEQLACELVDLMQRRR